MGQVWTFKLPNWHLKFMFSKKATKIEKILNLKPCHIDGEDFVKLCGLLRKHKLYLKKHQMWTFIIESNCNKSKLDIDGQLFSENPFLDFIHFKMYQNEYFSFLFSSLLFSSNINLVWHLKYLRISTAKNMWSDSIKCLTCLNVLQNN